MSTRLLPVWAGQTMRLDPSRLPQKVSYAGRDDFGDVTFTIDRGAVLDRVLGRSRLPVTVALPARAFIGVAARAMEDGEGNVTVTLELLHHDPMLCVPLLVAEDLEAVAADWRAWSEAYDLPMLLVEADGVARPLEQALEGAQGGSSPYARRQGSPTRSRRSRFQMRRKQGQIGMRLVIEGREIVAPC